ncbi:NUDIX hydrolase [Sporosarcina sp. ACRSL]|uniref:NUDIX domain-containing protein n=1 Tax=Sporosarcina sp. ACRSL TaxID=2918215 RepID=UPI001EF50CA7|nr:NUDIX hydrolase [Sporosarcina sp. ACRSL]MCG7344015.1 NUDIX hydrolase [Sporosarcina sp. ACRSL]
MKIYRTEEEALQYYDSGKYITPDGYTSDIAVFTLLPNEEPFHNGKSRSAYSLALMLIKRAGIDSDGQPNIEGNKWALPGGFIQRDETAYEAAQRELKEETGVEGIEVKHFGVYDKYGRDKRGWILSNAHYAIVPETYLEKRMASDDAAEVRLFTLDEVFQLELAFDHHVIIKDAVRAVERDVLQTTVVKYFLPKEFKMEELRQVLLAFVDDPVVKNKPGFFRKAPTLPFITEALDHNNEPKKTEPNADTRRPSKLYCFKDVDVTPSIWR